jgi:hypothetical protein
MRIKMIVLLSSFASDLNMNNVFQKCTLPTMCHFREGSKRLKIIYWQKGLIVYFLLPFVPAINLDKPTHPLCNKPKSASVNLLLKQGILEV